MKLSDLLEQKYIKFFDEMIELNINQEIINLFPEIEQIEWDQFISYLDIAFPDRQYTDEYIRQLADFQSVKLTDQEIDVLTPVVLRYLLFLDKVKSKM